MKRPHRIAKHDEFFRGAMTDLEVARDFLKQHLPKHLQKTIKLETLKLEPSTFVKKKLKNRMADLLYSVEISGATGYIYILIEHQSQADRFMPVRVIDYTIEIIYLHIKKFGPDCDLPIVLPLVFYNGKAKYPYSSDIFDLIHDPLNIAREMMFKSFRLIDLHDINDEILRENSWASVMQYMMSHIRKRDLLNYLLDATSRLQLILKSKKGKTYVMSLIDYVMTSSKLQAGDKFIDWIKSELTDIDESEVMTLAQRWVQQGKQEGLQEGVILGRQEGLEQGLKKGRLEERKEIAKNMLYKGHSVEMVVDATNLSFDMVQQLSDEILVL